MARFQTSVQLTTVVFHLFVLTINYGVCPFLLDGDKVNCPNPASNCLDETFNRVFDNLGCLGCQTGCQSGYIMTANPKYFVTEGDISGTYEYENLTIPNSKNVSEPQWVCLKGDSCPWGYFLDKMGSTDTCAYCGEGCRTCQSFDNCDQCVLGYHITSAAMPGGQKASLCTNTGVLCPSPPQHCEHETYVSVTVGCQGCIICEDGYLPTYNINYRRPPGNHTDSFDYQGVHVSGAIDLSEPRYTCEQGTTCPSGWHEITRGDLITCEVDPAVLVG